MIRDMNTPRNTESRKPGDPTFASQPDMTPRREGGDDAIAETSEALERSSPTDSDSDEKVIVNDPSQSVARNNDNGMDGE